jgi:hypothetical protein
MGYSLSMLEIAASPDGLLPFFNPGLLLKGLLPLHLDGSSAWWK